MNKSRWMRAAQATELVFDDVNADDVASEAVRTTVVISRLNLITSQSTKSMVVTVKSQKMCPIPMTTIWRLLASCKLVLCN